MRIIAKQLIILFLSFYLLYLIDILIMVELYKVIKLYKGTINVLLVVQIVIYINYYKLFLNISIPILNKLYPRQLLILIILLFFLDIYLFGIIYLIIETHL